jgi:hypothetical protein
MYRYRTGVLIGPWRADLRDAENDAILAGQAQRDGEQLQDLCWLVAGRIECDEDQPSHAHDRRS